MNWGFVDCKICISLSENIDKQEEFTNAMEAVGMCDVRWYVTARHPVDGKIGCNASHLKVIETAFGEGHDSLLVFEDDARPFHNRATAGVLEQIKKDVPANLEEWDVIYFGFMPYPVSCITNVPGKKLLKRCSRTWMSHAYMVSRPFMKVLLDRLNTHGPHYDIQLWNLARPDFRFVISPMLFYQDDRPGAASMTWLITSVISLKNLAVVQEKLSTCCLAVIAVLFLVVFCIFWRQYKRRALSKS